MGHDQVQIRQNEIPGSHGSPAVVGENLFRQCLSHLRPGARRREWNDSLRADCTVPVLNKRGHYRERIPMKANGRSVLRLRPSNGFCPAWAAALGLGRSDGCPPQSEMQAIG